MKARSQWIQPGRNHAKGFSRAKSRRRRRHFASRIRRPLPLPRFSSRCSSPATPPCPLVVFLRFRRSVQARHHPPVSCLATSSSQLYGRRSAVVLILPVLFVDVVVRLPGKGTQSL